MGGMSLANAAAMRRSEPAAASLQHAPEPAADKPYTAADLAEAWRAFAPANPAEALVNSIIAAAEPVQQPDGSYLLTITAPIQMEIMEREKPKVVSFLRERLGNSTVDFTLVLNEGELAPAYWPEQRVLAYMLEKNPEFAAMIRKYKLRLG